MHVFDREACTPIGCHLAWSGEAAVVQVRGGAQAKRVIRLVAPVNLVVATPVPWQRVIRHLVVLITRLCVQKDILCHEKHIRTRSGGLVNMDESMPDAKDHGCYVAEYMCAYDGSSVDTRPTPTQYLLGTSCARLRHRGTWYAENY